MRFNLSANTVTPWPPAANLRMVRRLKPSDATICLEYAVENDDSLDGSMAIKDAYHPDLFTLVPKSQLSKRHFDIHPIWSEYYDYEEREEIVSWGVNREW